MIQIPLKAGHHRIWLGSFFKGSGPVLLRKPIICVWVFRGGGGRSRPPVLPIDQHMLLYFNYVLIVMWVSFEINNPCGHH